MNISTWQGSRINLGIIFFLLASLLLPFLSYAQTTPITILATSMQKTVGGAKSIGGLYAWNIWSNGSIYTNVSIESSGLYTLKIRAYGQSAGGILPIMDVAVDDVSIYTTNVKSGSWNYYNVSTPLSQGSHKLSISFTNDAIIGREDRNLLIYDLTISQSSSPTPTPSTDPIQTGLFSIHPRLNTNFCVDISTYTNGDRVYIWQCSAGNKNQAFEFTSAGEIKIHGKCLDAYGGRINDPLIVWDCHGGANQKFTYDASTGLIRGLNNVCIDVEGGGMSNNNYLIMYGCDASNPNQIFDVVKISNLEAFYPFAGQRMHVDSMNGAAQNINFCPAMAKIADKPTASWLLGSIPEATSKVSKVLSQAANQNAMPVFVTYNIPKRDCGQYSSGGMTEQQYPLWVEAIAKTIGSTKAAVIIEPDALMHLTKSTCLTDEDKRTRLRLIGTSVTLFKKFAPNTAVYIDAGNNSRKASTMAGFLNSSNIAAADGFSINVSNFIDTLTNINFGTAISKLVGGKHFVIDVSRNGNGAGDTWCNPSGRALGVPPTGLTSGLVDAYLWIKAPGESDGTCNGGPAAGVFWPEYACGLAERAAW